jgi:hypothetical protein
VSFLKLEEKLMRGVHVPIQLSMDGVVEPLFGLAYGKSSFERHSDSDDSMRRGSHKEIKKVIHKRKGAKHLEDDKDYKTGDPWEKNLLTEVGEH